VDADEGAILAVAAGMNGVRQRIGSGAGFALDQNRHGGFCRSRGEADEPPRRGSLSAQASDLVREQLGEGHEATPDSLLLVRRDAGAGTVKRPLTQPLFIPGFPEVSMG
jgi:hypothetical protein